jgi:5-methylcytosine-specific restriction endonuclease McrA
MFKDTRVRKEYFNKRRQETMDFLRLLKSKSSCFICGYKEHTEILQFHHLNPTEKNFDFSRGSIGNISRKRLINEIDKCELLCPNCHNWLHYQETAKLE